MGTIKAILTTGKEPGVQVRKKTKASIDISAGHLVGASSANV
jgi:hypothetical protein